MEEIIKWLKEEVSKLRGYAVIIDGEGGEWEPVTTVSVEDIYELINQLDKLEVLSQEWIDEKAIHIRGLGNIIEGETIKNLLVPKQELPVIPEFVAEFLDGKEEYALYELLDSDFIYDNHDKLARWLYDNDGETNREREFNLVLAHLYGYEVEEEPLYRARLKVITDEFIASYLCTQSSDAEERLKALEIGSKYIHEDYRHLSEFTEDELKRLDIWDSEQWEIEELG